MEIQSRREKQDRWQSESIPDETLLSPFLERVVITTEEI
jgi:hypothetical protein